jgi:hypothetical protein
MSFREAKRREIPKIFVCQTRVQGFLAPVVARNDIRMVNCVSPKLSIPAPADMYELWAGLYRLETGQQLPATMIPAVKTRYGWG